MPYDRNNHTTKEQKDQKQNRKQKRKAKKRRKAKLKKLKSIQRDLGHSPYITHIMFLDLGNQADADFRYFLA